MTTVKNTFAEIITLESFLDRKGLEMKHIKLAKTSNGSILLTALGGVIATIKSELQGRTLQQTVQNMATTLCFGIPHEGTFDNAGRPSLPCCMESKSQWEEISLF